MQEWAQRSAGAEETKQRSSRAPTIGRSTLQRGAPLMAAPPSIGAVSGDSAPWKAPTGVRAAATMTASV